LGITLIELALGRFPFSSDDSTESDDDSDLREMTQRGGLPTDADRTAQGDSVPLTLAPPTTLTADKRKSKGVSLGGGGMTMSILDLLQHIVNEPAPRLTANAQGERFPRDAEEFVESCLQKDPTRRANPKDLLVSWKVYWACVRGGVFRDRG
jgi:mitogen-activated protein kinase kinase